jgi:hypothetical protein
VPQVPLSRSTLSSWVGRVGFVWAYRSVDSPHSNAPRLVVFDYQSGRAGKHAANFLQDWKGELMVDDYAGYKALFTSGITDAWLLGPRAWKNSLTSRPQAPTQGPAKPWHKLARSTTSSALA